jgi:hypothetical protein
VKRKDIARYLKPYSILQARRTTVANAFASALAPSDRYDDALIREALTFLGQDPDGDLTCLYCGKKAETWDHVYSLVKAGEYAGYGHALGNLVPCCKSCNSSKGGTNWFAFIDRVIIDEQRRISLQSMLYSYIERFGHPRFAQSDIATLYAEQMARYRKIQGEILDLMREADDLAAIIRAQVEDRLGLVETADDG